MSRFSRRTDPHRLRVVIPAIALISVAVGLSACGNDAPVPLTQTVDIVMDDFTIDAPDTVQAGLVEVRSVNNGTVAHQAVFAKLPAGLSADAFVESMMTDLADAVETVDMRGGVQLVQPGGGTQDATISLEAGNYVLLCDLPGPEAGSDHLQHGMWTELTVVGAVDDDVDRMPVAGTIELIDWAFGVPETIESGASYRVVNDGTQVHEIGLAALVDEDANVDDVLAFLSGEAPEGTPSPIENLSGIGWISPGESQTFTIDVPPGRYVFACYIVDPDDGLPHFMKGMLSIVEIT